MSADSKQAQPRRGLGVAIHPAIVAQAVVHLSEASAALSGEGRSRRATAAATVASAPTSEKRSCTCPLCADGMSYAFGVVMLDHLDGHAHQCATVATNLGPFIIPAKIYASEKLAVAALDAIMTTAGVKFKTSSSGKSGGFRYLTLVCPNFERILPRLVNNVEHIASASASHPAVILRTSTDLSIERSRDLGRGVGVASALVANCPARAFINERGPGQWELRVYGVHAHSCLESGSTHVAPSMPHREMNIADFINKSTHGDVDAAWAAFILIYPVSLFDVSSNHFNHIYTTLYIIFTSTLVSHLFYSHSFLPISCLNRRQMIIREISLNANGIVVIVLTTENASLIMSFW